MNTPLHNELRKEFQLERLILFSDAVFAIADNEKKNRTKTQTWFTSSLK